MTTDALIYNGARWQSMIDGPGKAAYVDKRPSLWQQTYDGTTFHKVTVSSVLHVGPAFSGPSQAALQENNYVLFRFGYMLDVAISPVWAKFKFIDKDFSGFDGTMTIRPVHTDDAAAAPDTFPLDTSVAPVNTPMHGTSGEVSIMLPSAWITGFADGRYNTLQVGPAINGAQDYAVLEPGTGELTVEVAATPVDYAPEFGVRSPAGWEQIDGLTSATAQIWDGSAWWP